MLGKKKSVPENSEIVLEILTTFYKCCESEHLEHKIHADTHNFVP